MARKPRVVIIGAGMAGLTAANRLYRCTGSREKFELCVVEGGSRIGGRINTSEFGGDRIEMGATWIHGIQGSPLHKLAQEIQALESEQPWECMDGLSDEPKTVAEGGYELSPSLVNPISNLFNSLMDFAQGKKKKKKKLANSHHPAAQEAATSSKNEGFGKLSIGAFLRQGLEAYWDSMEEQEELNGYAKWSRKTLEEAIFAMLENTQRTYTSAGDLFTLDYAAESEYRMFPGEEITIAKGYLSIIEYLASPLPPGLIQLGRRVTRIDWQSEHQRPAAQVMENGSDPRPVKLHFSDGSVMLADHVVITVSLGVLKAGISQDSGLFNPPLPSFKTRAISRLGYGVVNKLFLQLSPDSGPTSKFPPLQMVFHRPESGFRQEKIPWWMRRTATLSPIHHNSSVLLSWFAGEEAAKLESISDEEIKTGVSAAISGLLPQETCMELDGICNGSSRNASVRFTEVLRSKWGSDPLFLGSYSYVALGSTGDDLDTMAEPLPQAGSSESEGIIHPLQILFAGEATHRTHYSTTHGAYFSGLREADRLLQHYQCLGA